MLQRQVKDVMTDDCKTVTLQDNIYEIACIMAKDNVGFVPVVDMHDRTQLIGVVTDRDLVIRGYAEKKQGSTAVSEVMSDNALITISPDQDAEEAADIMAHYQVRRLPVVENGKLVGVVALGDLALGNTTAHDAGVALQEISEIQH